MGRKFRDTVTTNQVRVKQKNGSTYIYERSYKYNPETRQNVCLSNKLIGKIPKGETEMVPTRPKKPDGQGPLSFRRPPEDKPAKAARESGILTEILEWAGRESGIDADLQACMSPGDAQKTASIARYMVAEKKPTIPGIEEWQITHPIPYVSGLSADSCYALFETLGQDESARQSLFRKRADRLEKHPMIAFDSTTMTTSSELLPEARAGHSKAGGIEKVIKYLTLYSVETMQPIAFEKQPGNLPDVTSLLNAVAELEVLGVSKPQLVTDCGYWSDPNLTDLCHAGTDFIMLVRGRPNWIRDAIDEALPTIRQPQNIDPDKDVFVQSVTVSRQFNYERKRGSRKKKLKAGDKEPFSKTLFVHVCLNPISKLQAERALAEDIKEVIAHLEAGVPFEELSQSGQSIAEKYLVITKNRRGRILSIDWNQEAYEKECRYHGIFVLVASKEKDGIEALHRYRRREKIEDFFHVDKEDVDGDTPRVWSSDRLLGRMTAQFAALCYDEFLRMRLRLVKEYLRREHANPSPGRTDADIKLDNRVLSWLEGMSLHKILAWFDVYENLDVSTEIRHKRWNAATTRRDRRFLQLLMETDFS